MIGNEIKISVVKNKVAPPFKKTTVILYFGKGISKVDEIIDLAVDYNLIDKAGSWYSYNGEKIAQGKEKLRQYFDLSKEIYKEIEGKVLLQFGNVN